MLLVCEDSVCLAWFVCLRGKQQLRWVTRDLTLPLNVCVVVFPLHAAALHYACFH